MIKVINNKNNNCCCYRENMNIKTEQSKDSLFDRTTVISNEILYTNDTLPRRQSPVSQLNNQILLTKGGSIDKKLRKCSKDDINFYALDHLYRTKQLKKQRRQDIQKLFNESASINQKYSTSNSIANNINVKASVFLKSNSSEKKKVKKSNCCKFTVIFDPNGRLSYWMSKFKIRKGP